NLPADPATDLPFLIHANVAVWPSGVGCEQVEVLTLAAHLLEGESLAASARGDYKVAGRPLRLGIGDDKVSGSRVGVHAVAFNLEDESVGAGRPVGLHPFFGVTWLGYIDGFTKCACLHAANYRQKPRLARRRRLHRVNRLVFFGI